MHPPIILVDTVKRVILPASNFVILECRNIVAILLHFYFAFSQYSTNKLNFHRYLISRFYTTREIRENFKHAKITRFTVLTLCYIVNTAYIP